MFGRGTEGQGQAGVFGEVLSRPRKGWSFYGRGEAFRQWGLPGFDDGLGWSFEGGGKAVW